MQTRTLIEAISQIKAKDNEVRFKMLLNLFEVYSIPFSRQNAMQIFGDVPATFVFKGHDKFQVEKCIFTPTTMADYISIVESLGLNIRPDFDSAYNRKSSENEAVQKRHELIKRAVTMFWRKG